MRPTDTTAFKPFTMILVCVMDLSAVQISASLSLAVQHSDHTP